MIRYFLYKFAEFLINTFPLKFSYAIAQFFSDCQYTFSAVDRRAVTQNLEIILKDQKDLKFHVREVFRNFGRYLIEFFWMKKHVNEEYIKKNVVFNGKEYIDQALSKNKGVILVTAHIGNWELGAALFRYLGYKISAIALPHKNQNVDRLFNEQREAQGVNVIPVQVAVRRCYEALQANGLVAIVADRDFTQSGFELDFFGKQVLIPKGPALLSLKTGVPILPAFLVRSSTGFEVLIRPPIFPPEIKGKEPTEAELTGLMKKYLVYIVDIIRRYPSQWLMFRTF